MAISDSMFVNILLDPLFDGLTEIEKQIIQQALEEKIYSKEEIIVKEGEYVTSFYFLMQGSILYAKPTPTNSNQKIVHQLNAPNVFGESSLIEFSFQPYDIRAAEEQTIVYLLDCQSLKNKEISHLLLLNLVQIEIEKKRLPSTLATSEYRPYKKIEEKITDLQFLKQEFLNNWLPSELTKEEKRDIEKIIDLLHVEENTICITQKEIIQSFYVILQGQLRVLNWEEAKKEYTVIDTLYAGDSLGENSLLTPFACPYTIQANCPTDILLVTRQKLEQFAKESAMQKLILHLTQYTPDPAKLIKKNYQSTIFLQTPQESDWQDAKLRLAFMHNHPMMQNITEAEIISLHDKMQYQEYFKGEQIVLPVENKRDLFFILEGQLLVNEENKETQIKSPDLFNEKSFLTGCADSTNAEITQKTKLLRLPFSVLEKTDTFMQKIGVLLLTNAANWMKNQLEQKKIKNEEELQTKITNYIKQKNIWKLFLLSLVLNYLNTFTVLEVNTFLPIIFICIQVLLPFVFIHKVLKESIRNWGGEKKYFFPSLLQAVICIMAVGLSFEFIAQIIDKSDFHFFSLVGKIPSILTISTIGNYLLFVIAEEWLKRGIIVSALRRNLEELKTEQVAVVSALLFLGNAAFYSPFLAIFFFIKDISLAFLFLKAPHIIGVIFIHFVLGIFFASFA